MLIPELETDRLILRGYRLDDLDRVHEIFSHEEVARFVMGGKPASREQAWKLMALALGHWDLMGYGLWAIVEKQSGVLIGEVGIQFPVGFPHAEVGWSLDRAFWGAGFATEAAREAIRFGFDQLKLEYLISLIADDNLSSQKVAQRLGHYKTLEVFEFPDGMKTTIWRIDNKGGN